MRTQFILVLSLTGLISWLATGTQAAAIEKTVSGKVVAFRKSNVRGQDAKTALVLLKPTPSRYMVVDLGSVDQLKNMNVESGERIVVKGEIFNLGGFDLLVASRLWDEKKERPIFHAREGSSRSNSHSTSSSTDIPFNPFTQNYVSYFKDYNLSKLDERVWVNDYNRDNGYDYDTGFDYSFDRSSYFDDSRSPAPYVSRYNRRVPNPYINPYGPSPDIDGYDLWYGYVDDKYYNYDEPGDPIRNYVYKPSPFLADYGLPASPYYDDFNNMGENPNFFNEDYDYASNPYHGVYDYGYDYNPRLQGFNSNPNTRFSGYGFNNEVIFD